MDITPFLNDDETNFYQSQISILRWMVELGRLDIYFTVASLSSYLCQPRQGHLEAVYYIYGYLKSHSRSSMVFDSSYINWRDEDFPQQSWQDFYPNVEEDIPSNAPEPRGLPVQINMFVDASHARNKVTRRSHTGILMYLNMAPIVWYSKTQRTVETSTFGAEFVALKIGTE
ncbi:MAG: Ty1/Copia family ribonuclease HI [bacterium]